MFEAEAEHWLAALGAANTRIGRTPIARLEWLLHFAEPERLAELTRTQFGELEGEAYAFIGPLAPAGSGSRPPALDRDSVMRVALQVRQGIVGLSTGRRWSFHVTALRRHVSPLPKGGFISSYSAENWQPAFLMRAADLMVEQGTRIRRCAWKDCGRLFLRRKGGLYCSKACSQKERTARMEQKLGQEGWSQRRHSYYERKMRQLYGQKVTVQRRKPRGE